VKSGYAGRGEQGLRSVPLCAGRQTGGCYCRGLHFGFKVAPDKWFSKSPCLFLTRCQPNPILTSSVVVLAIRLLYQRDSLVSAWRWQRLLLYRAWNVYWNHLECVKPVL
jgi:hypothetical protein